MVQRSDPPGGAESYPFDPRVRAEQQRDLDRLRGFADRKLAAYLFDLYLLAANNSGRPPTRTRASATSMVVVGRPPTRTRASATSMVVVRRLATQALAGQLGTEARDLAEALVLDATGRERVDESTLRSFAHAYRELKRG
jgi:hypothetical protein